MDGVTVVVGDHLHLNVPRADQQLLQVERAVPEGFLGLLLRHLHGLAQLLLVFRHPDAPATAAGRRLDHYRVADLLRRFYRFVGGSDLLRAGHHRHFGLPGQPACR